VAVQAFLTEAAVEGFALRIVCRLAGPAEVDFHPIFVCPFVHGFGDELAAVIGFDDARQAAQCTYATERRHHIVTPQVLPNVDGQTLSGVIVDQSQRTQAATIEQLVHDEVHAPDVIDGLRDRFGLATLRRLIALGALVPQRQALFSIQTVDPFVIVPIAFAAQHYVYTPVSVVNARMRYLVDSHDQRATVASARFVAIQRSGNHDCGACLGHAYAVALHQIIHEYAAP
jgi:hypothetical protein